ncbi:hypothetical protein [Gloeocapsopsis crepidinum]|nr:hypothetical protein [Gloeocapsopsis crepidinum]
MTSQIVPIHEMSTTNTSIIRPRRWQRTPTSADGTRNTIKRE